MKKILCFGDSNTYGYNPLTDSRYEDGIVWTDILQELLKDEYVVYNEGLNGRTTAYDRDLSDELNGYAHFIETLNKYGNIDYLIIMLGTNDCNVDMHLNSEEIALGMEKLIITAKEYYKDSLPKIIIVTPAAILDEYEHSLFAYQLDKDSVIKSHEIAPLYKQLCDKYNCVNIDCSNTLEVHTIDSEHLTIKGHNDLAHILYGLIYK